MLLSARSGHFVASRPERTPLRNSRFTTVHELHGFVFSKNPQSQIRNPQSLASVPSRLIRAASCRRRTSAPVIVTSAFLFRLLPVPKITHAVQKIFSAGTGAAGPLMHCLTFCATNTGSASVCPARTGSPHLFRAHPRCPAERRLPGSGATVKPFAPGPYAACFTEDIILRERS